MRNEDLQVISDKILPSLYRFSAAIAPDQLLGEQVLVDAMTVFYLENKDYFIDEKFDPNDREQRISISKYIKEQLMQEIYLLMEKKSYIQQARNELISPEYLDFSKLNSKEKAVLYLKEVEQLSMAKIQTLLSLKYHDLIQIFYNAKDKMLNETTGDHELSNFMEQVSNSRNLHIIGSYVYGLCREEQKDRVERLLSQDRDIKDYFLLKQNERDFLRQLIPEINLKKNHLTEVRREIVSTINELIPSKENGLVSRMKRALTKPIVRIEI